MGVRQWMSGLLCCGLVSCAAPNDTSWWGGFDRLSSAHADNDFVFDWQLAGDDSVAPYQVFNSAQQLWLHYPSGSSLPAIFAKDDQGLHATQGGRRGEYWVIDGTWQALYFRGGSYEAWAYKPQAEHYIHSPSAAVHSPVPDTPIPLTSPAPPPASSSSSPIDIPAAPDKVSVVQASATPAFQLGPDDGNLRQVLKRWAGTEGWTFNDEHWTVAIDLPITAGHDFGANFEQAVQVLVASAALAGHPLQPCFYVNKVLRVIPFAQTCGLANTNTQAELL